MRVGFVVNPIAGMGGRVGLKGTDGKAAEARERGAEPRAPDRAVACLEALLASDPDVDVVTYGGDMGETEARVVGLDPTVVGEPSDPSETTPADTRNAVRAFVDAGVDLVLFVGGDGTAVDVLEALEDADTPVLGVPAGVKVFSSVFAVDPEAAGRIAATFGRVEEREVLDLDEEAYRAGEVETTLRGVLPVPVAEGLQASKQLGGGTVEGAAAGFAESVEPGTTYVFGPGSTVGAIERELGFEGSPLGVDVWRADAESGSGPPAGEVVVTDGSEAEVLAALGERNVVVVSPIGGQGFVFGRGNDQLSPAILGRDDVDVAIVASRAKLDDLGVLRVDTGDEAVDDAVRGWHRVRIGRVEHRLVEVV